MMKSIKEKAEEYIGDYYKRLGVDKNLYPIDVEISKADFHAGANYVLGEVENFMKDLDLGNSAEEKFYKLDVIADISSFIRQLKK